MLWRLKNNGKSCNSCIAKDMDEVKRVNIIIHQLYNNFSATTNGTQQSNAQLDSLNCCKIVPNLCYNQGFDIHPSPFYQAKGEGPARKYSVTCSWSSQFTGRQISIFNYRSRFNHSVIFALF
jgi:hypothetical protein